jgi:hypothetical protein
MRQGGMMSRRNRRGATRAARTVPFDVQLAFRLLPDPMASELETVFRYHNTMRSIGDPTYLLFADYGFKGDGHFISLRLERRTA